MEVYQNLPTPAQALETFAYDDVGNRTGDSDYNDYTYNSNNQLTTYDSGDIDLYYDNNGNLTKKSVTGTGDTIYGYDYENRLVRIDYPDSDYSTYKYDGIGRRVEKRDKSGNISRYVYDNRNIIAEYDGSNTLVANYVQSLGIDKPISMYRGGEMYWYHKDALGSVYQMTDDSEAVVRTYDYTAFGTIDSQTGALANPFTYTAREYESDSGLYYYRARYYDAELGRFLQRDPMKIQAGIAARPNIAEVTNNYFYVRNNPALYYDPYGLQAGAVCLGLAVPTPVGGVVIGSCILAIGAICVIGLLTLPPAEDIWCQLKMDLPLGDGRSSCTYYCPDISIRYNIQWTPCLKFVLPIHLILL